MKLSYTTLSVKDKNIHEAIGIACKNKLDGIELRGMADSHVSCSSSFSYVSDVKHMLADAGLAVPCLTSYEKLNHESMKDAEKDADSLLHVIELADYLSAKTIRVFMGKIEPGSDISRIEDNRAFIMERTKDSPVKIVIETHDSARTGSDLNRILKNAPDCYGVLWDIIHPWYMGETYTETWNLIGERVFHMHIKDVRQKLPEPLHDYCAIGTGVIPVREIVHHVMANGYDGFYSLEWEPSSPEYEGISFEDSISQFVPFMRSLENEN